MITRQQSNARMSQIVSFPLTGNMVILAGQVADNRSAGIREQSADVLAKIDRLLADAGTDKTAVVSAYVWLPNIGDFDAFNSVWDQWVAAGHTPARACVEAKLADPRLLVEVQVIAVKP